MASKAKPGYWQGKLMSGTACSVCGSLDHPEPAKSATDLPTEEDLKSAKNDVDIMNKELLDVERAWLKLKTEADISHEATTEKLAEVLSLIPEFNMDELTSFQHNF